jgi:hypothetical protein
MIKTRVRDLPVITIHINEGDKTLLTSQADKLGMRLTTYCRMILLKAIEAGK